MAEGAPAFTLFTVYGVTTRITLVSVGSFVLSGIALAWLATSQSQLSFVDGWLVGLACVLIMLGSEWLHQMGHAWAARPTGYPMVGILFFSVLAASVYPPREPKLPGRVHIRRALGGFWVNVLMGLLVLAALRVWPSHDWAVVWLMGFTVFYNILILGLGALVPIDLPGVLTTDGATILKHWRKLDELS
jgi:Zn-dependent protease